MFFRRFFTVDTPESSSTRSDWRVGADYQITDDFMLYASAATGYRAGGFHCPSVHTIAACGLRTGRRDQL